MVEPEGGLAQGWGCLKVVRFASCPSWFNDPLVRFNVLDYVVFPLRLEQYSICGKLAFVFVGLGSFVANQISWRGRVM